MGEDVKHEVREVVKDYKESSYKFSVFVKESLLPSVFRIVGEPYAFVDTIDKQQSDDESKYLDTNNLPFKS